MIHYKSGKKTLIYYLMKKKYATTRTAFAFTSYNAWKITESKQSLIGKVLQSATKSKGQRRHFRPITTDGELQSNTQDRRQARENGFLPQQQQQFIYKFRLHKGLVPQIATKLVEAGQDEHENIMEQKLQ